MERRAAALSARAARSTATIAAARALGYTPDGGMAASFAGLPPLVVSKE